MVISCRVRFCVQTTFDRQLFVEKLEQYSLPLRTDEHCNRLPKETIKTIIWSLRTCRVSIKNEKQAARLFLYSPSSSPFYDSLLCSALIIWQRYFCPCSYLPDVEMVFDRFGGRQDWAECRGKVACYYKVTEFRV